MAKNFTGTSHQLRYDNCVRETLALDGKKWTSGRMTINLDV